MFIRLRRLSAESIFIVVLIWMATSCGIDLHKASTSKLDLDQSQFKLRTTSRKFESCSQLQASYRRQLLAKKRFDQSYERSKVRYQNGSVPSTSADSPTTETFTNVQESGVDEADSTKIGEHHILVAIDNRIQVVDRHTMTNLGALRFKNPIMGLYVDGDRLDVIIGSHSGLYCGLMEASRTPDYVELRSYKLIAGESPSFLFKRKILGSYYESRASLGKIYIVTQSEIPYVESIDKNLYDLSSVDIPKDPLDLSKLQKYGWSCDELMQQQVEDAANSFAAIHVIDTSDDLQVTQRVGILGSADFIYMAKNQFVASRLASKTNPWSGGFLDDTFNEVKTTLVSFNLNSDTGKLEDAAAASVDGYAIGPWSVKEFPTDAALAIMTTTGSSWNITPRNELQNHLSIFKRAGSKLKLKAQIRNFGSGESIQAVRYIGSIAYAITFMQTDPLFAFDLSNLDRPRKLGELHMPGFSTYLHPVADGRLLGVGFDADKRGARKGMQVFLFDTEDPQKLKLVTKLKLGGNSSSSGANYDHHAFFYSKERAITAFPVSNCHYVADNYGCTYEAWVLGVDSEKFDKMGAISHRSLLDGDCFNSMYETSISRIFEIDDHLVSISRLGVQQHKFSDLSAPAKVVVFPESRTACKAICSRSE